MSECFINKYNDIYKLNVIDGLDIYLNNSTDYEDNT